MREKYFNFFPALADVIFILVFLIGSFNAVTLLADGDTGYHIRAGDFIINHLAVPKHDIFSFHEPVLNWTAHEWLSEVVMAFIYRAGAFNALCVAFAAMIALTCRKIFVSLAQENNVLIALIMTILVIQTSMIHWLVRPHIFSLLIITYWYFTLNLFQYQNKNYLVIFPIVMLIWVNLHGGYIVGFLLLGIYGLGNLVHASLSENSDREEFLRKFKALFITGLVCLAVSFINPRTYEILIFPFKFMTHKYLMDHNNELLSPNFHHFTSYTFYLFLLLLVLAVCKPRLNYIETLLALAFTYLSLTSIRHIPLFAIILAPVVAKRLNYSWKNARFGWKERVDEFSDRIYLMDKSAIPILGSIVAVLAVAVTLYYKDIHFTFSPKVKPVAAFEFVQKENISGNMFCDDEFGDYIIYAGKGKYKVFMDGRNDMYGSRIMKQYFQVTELKRPWKTILKKFNINWIIFPTNTPLSAALKDSSDWGLVYSDKVASIFVKKSSQNAILLKKHPTVKLASVI